MTENGNSELDDDVLRGALIGTGLCMAELLAHLAAKSGDPDKFVEDFGERVSEAIARETENQPNCEGVAQSLLDNMCVEAMRTLDLLG